MMIWLVHILIFVNNIKGNFCKKNEITTVRVIRREMSSRLSITEIKEFRNLSTKTLNAERHRKYNEIIYKLRHQKQNKKL